MTLDPTLLLFPDLHTLPTADAWRDLLVPSLLGGHPSPPASRTPEAEAAWLRCLLLRGDPDRAHRALRGTSLPAHPDTAALAAWLDGRCPPPPPPGAAWQVADAWCDRAVWLRLRGSEGPAQGAVEEALSRVPHHAEATLLGALRGRPLPALLHPQPTLCWYSPHRIERRLRGGAWLFPARRPRPHVQAGIRLRIAASAAPGGLQVDALADHLRTRHLCGLPLSEPAAMLWAAARRLGHPTALAAARLLTRLLPPADPSHRAAVEVLDSAGHPVGSPPRRRSPQLHLPR